MPNGTYGGVRGRKTKVGRKLLRFPPTRFTRTSAVCKDANRQRFVVQGRDTACEKRKNVLLYNKKQERGRRLPSPYCSYA